MPEAVHSFDRIKSYDCSSYITKEDDSNASSYLLGLIEKGKFMTVPPGRQNFGCLFTDHGNLWDVYKTSFIKSVSEYLNKEITPLSLVGWSYMTNEDLQGDRTKLWHIHWDENDSNEKWISGIYLLQTQKDYPYAGTEFSLSGNDNDQNTVFLETKEQHWNIYPANMWHRPGIALGKDYRIVIAADLLYLDN